MIDTARAAHAISDVDTYMYALSRIKRAYQHESSSFSSVLNMIFIAVKNQINAAIRESRV